MWDKILDESRLLLLHAVLDLIAPGSASSIVYGLLQKYLCVCVFQYKTCAKFYIYASKYCFQTQAPEEEAPEEAVFQLVAFFSTPNYM